MWVRLVLSQIVMVLEVWMPAAATTNGQLARFPKPLVVHCYQ